AGTDRHEGNPPRRTRPPPPGRRTRGRDRDGGTGHRDRVQQGRGARVEAHAPSAAASPGGEPAPHRLQIRRAPGVTTVRRDRVTVDGHVYEVEVEDSRARPVVARVEGDTFLVDVEPAAVREDLTETAPAVAPAVVPAPILTGPPPPGRTAGDDVLTAPI